MKWTVGTKIAGGFLLTLFALLIVNTISYRNTSNLADTAKWVTHSYKVLGTLDDLLSNLKDAETGQRGFLLTGSDSYLAPYNTAYKNVEQDLLNLKNLLSDNPAEEERLSQLEPLILGENGKFAELKQTISLRRGAQGFETALALVKTDKGKNIMDAIRTLIAEMENQESDLLAKRAVETQASTDLTLNTIIYGSLITLLLLSLSAYLITRNISKPLEEISNIAEKIATGDLNVDISPTKRTDEIGILMRSFSHMIQSLQKMATIAEKIASGDLSETINPQSETDILGNAFLRMTNALQTMADIAEQIAEGDIRAEVKPQSDKDVLGVAFARMNNSILNIANIAQQIAMGNLTKIITPQSEKDILGKAFVSMTENLRKLISEINTSVNVVLSSSNEIMAFTSQIASGANETASAIATTTTTLEEVKQNSQFSNQKAKSVSEEAHKAADVAKQGSQTVEQTIIDMEKIQHQMAVIEENLLNLNSQSQSIGDIIKTVDKLATQSKLLALNASIEASSAGEAGKGFGIVAQEVKSLAEQSQQATSQVRNVLNNIQIAMNNTVLATEEGSKSIKVGMEQSKLAGTTITTLASNAAHAAQAAGEIALTSDQQFVGVDQIVVSMEEIKTASMQNAESTKQAKVAVEQLNDLGQVLKKLLQKFKI